MKRRRRYQLNRSLADYSIVGLKRSISASMARKNGKKFEDELELACEVYRKEGKAVFARAHPPVGGMPGQMFYVGKGQTDFIGVMMGQVPVAFDAKSCSGDPASWRYPTRDVFQAEFLRDFSKMGGLGFVLLKTTAVTYFLFDVEALARGDAIQLRPVKSRGPKAMEKVERLVPFIRRRQEPPAWDFFPTLLKHYETDWIGIDHDEQRTAQPEQRSDPTTNPDSERMGETF